MYFERFVRERNIKPQTIAHYRTAINKYTSYYGLDIDTLIGEAIKEEEDNLISKRQRSIKSRMLQFRTHLVTDTNLKISSINNTMKYLKSLYRHFEVDIPTLPPLKDTDKVETTYYDLPTKKQIAMALEIAGKKIASLILFMCSSGTARAECASITVGDFINACEGYYKSETLPEIIEELYYSADQIVPTFRIFRKKTQKKYYTFCTPQATHSILDWLMLRLEICEVKGEELILEDSLWGLDERRISYHFARINDELNFGYRDEYRFFRPHTLRKFNGSNIGLSQDHVDLLHGRSQDAVHAAYIKTNPEELKKVYMNVMENVTIGDFGKKEVIHEDFTININLNFYGKEYGVDLA